ncbi:MAG: hypothetical protein ARM1_0731 [Candidatus Micrarchaeota archaeon]|nr:MAG: hypothetical protein ARM1_0731 [Candidatus Micrarchaeota archaeon]
MDELERLKRERDLYLFIIEKYKDYIEKEEYRSIAALSSLITPDIDEIEEFLIDIRSKYEPFVYNKDMLHITADLLSKINSSILELRMPIELWLYPRDVIMLKVGDKIDIANLITSILITLGSSTAKTIVNNYNDQLIVGSYFSFNDKYYLIRDGVILIYNSLEELYKAVYADKTDEAFEYNNTYYRYIKI